MRGGLDVSDGLAVDAPYSLPNGWQWTNFGAACINRDSERIPVRSADRALRQGEYDYYGASGAIDKIDDYLFDGELLLIGEDGANLVLRSTPIAFIASGRFWVNNHAHVIDSLSSAALRYLAVYVNSIDLKPYLTGIAQPKLNQKRLNSIPVPIPPEAEQGRIVAKVDELMQLCDDLEAREQARHHVTTRLRASSLDALTTAETDDDLHAAWSRVQANWEALTDHPDCIDALRQTILKLAVRGKLVAQDPDDPDAHRLFRELVAERKRLTSEKAIRRRATLPPVELDEQPFQLPSTWTWVRLDDIGGWGAGATPKRGESRYYGGPHDWFKSGELSDSPALSGPSDETVTDDALAECSLRLNGVGDVLVAMYGATIGRTAILATEGTTNQAVCACTCFSGFDNEFLFLLVRSWRKELVQMGAGGAQPNISREDRAEPGPAAAVR